MTNSNRQCKLAGPQQREIGSPIPTNNASWRGPQYRSWRKVSLQKCASWRGPNIEKLEPQFLQTMQVGVGHR
ncbi:nitrogen fixation protein NifR [Staphylococcus aureus]|nr:nitrogen fixation protein NifR [Staphylococcus aureus]